MSKKITSYEELLKLAKECEKLIELRIKKWGELKEETIKIVIGISSDETQGKRLADQLATEVIEHIKKRNYENVAVFLGEFKGYDTEKPTMEIRIPNTGNVVFGNLEPLEATEIIDRYLEDIEKKKVFFLENDGSRECDCH